MIERQRVSGQTVQAFCAEHDVGEASFYAWRRHFRDQASQLCSASNPTDAPDASQPNRGAAGFVRLEPEAEASGNAVEVRFACGATLRCASAHLPELVRLLKHEGQEAGRC